MNPLIEELDRLEKEATPGEWGVSVDSRGQIEIAPFDAKHDLDWNKEIALIESSKADALFIIVLRGRYKELRSLILAGEKLAEEVEKLESFDDESTNEVPDYYSGQAGSNDHWIAQRNAALAAYKKETNL